MGLLDYSYNAPSPAPGISGVADMLVHVLQERARQQQAVAQLQLQQEQVGQQRLHQQELTNLSRQRNEAEIRRLDEQEARDKGQEAEKASTRVSGLARELGPLIGSGNTQGARALIGSQLFYNRATGKMEPAALDVSEPAGPEPVEPVAPQPPQAPVDEEPSGGLTSDELEPDRAKVHQGKVAAYESALQGFPAQKAEYEQKLGRFRADKVNRENQRSFNVRTPGGQAFSFDVATQRYAGNKLNAMDFTQKIGGALQSRLDQAQQLAAIDPVRGTIAVGEAREKLALLPELQARIEAGMPPIQAQALLDKSASQARKEIVAYDAQTRSIEAKHQDVQTMANRPQASITVGGRNADVNEERDFRSERDKFEKRWDIPTNVKAFHNLNHQLKSLETDNPELQSAVQFAIARSIQGVGPLTDRDLDRLRAVPGVGAKLENAMQAWDDGTLGDDTKQVLTEATKKIVGDKVQTMKAARDNFAEYYDPDLPYLGRFGKGYLDSQARLLFGTVGLDAPQTNAPNTKPRRSTHGSGGTKVKVQASGAAAAGGPANLQNTVNDLIGRIRGR